MAFFIKKGVVKVYNITSGGDEKIVGYESAGSLLPLGWLFDRAPVSLYYYDTFTDCEVYRLPKSEIRKVINSNHKATMALLDQMISMYIGATMHLHALEQSRASNKLLFIMQFLVLRFGRPINKTENEIDLRLTHQDIANLMGTTRETASSEISQLTKAGVLRIKDFKYIVNTDKAQRLLGEEDFGEVTL